MNKIGFCCMLMDNWRIEVGGHFIQKSINLQLVYQKLVKFVSIVYFIEILSICRCLKCIIMQFIDMLALLQWHFLCDYLKLPWNWIGTNVIQCRVYTVQYTGMNIKHSLCIRICNVRMIVFLIEQYRIIDVSVAFISSLW